MGTATARDLLTGAMENIGVIDPGEAISASDAQMGLRTLNKMLGNLNTQKLLMIGVNISEFDLVPGTETYTLGDGADFDLDSPVYIKAAFVRDNTGVEFPVEIIRDSEKWGDIRDKNLVSSHPYYIFINDGAPTQNVYLHPIPVNTNTLILQTVRKLSEFTDLSDISYYADGYEEMIENNLSVRLAPKFGTSVSAETAMLARECLADVKRSNIRAVEVKVDRALRRNAQPLINQGTSGSTDNNPFYFGDENNPLAGDARIVNQGSEIIFQIYNDVGGTWDFAGSMSL